MVSKGKEERLAQRRYWEDQLKQRLSELNDKGLASDKVTKDTTVRKLRAKIRETDERLKVIETKDQKVVEMAKAKAEKLAAPKVKKSGKKKAAEDKPAESKRQQKKKKKKESKDKA